MNRVLVIAEPGCTHEGRFDAMLSLIGIAADAGADVFKAQWVSDVAQMCQRRNAHDYAQYYRWINFPVEWHPALELACRKLGMQYACTSYLADDVEIVDPCVSLHKIASFEADDVALVRAAMKTGKPVLISTGMMSSSPWEVFTDDDDDGDIRLLHCTSSYPAPLGAMELRDQFGWDNPYSGLSDHSRHELTGAVAVGAGASIIEAHIRNHGTPKTNPDYAVSFDPVEFARYVANIRIAEQLMGSGTKQIQPCEEPMLRYKVKA